MKIALLADAFLPQGGGSRVYYYNLYKNLVAQWADRVVVLTKKVPGWKEFDSRESTESLRIVRRFRPFLNLKYYQWPRAVWQSVDSVWFALREQVDVVHIGDLLPQGLAGPGLKHLRGVPYVMFAHGDEIAQTDRRRYQPILRDRIYRNADAVIAANEIARQSLIRIGVPERRIYKITPGVDCERFRPQPPNEALVREFDLQGKTVLLTAARLVPRKNLDTVIQAVGRVACENSDLRYLILGDGAERQHLEQIVENLGLRSVVRFVGPVSNRTIGDFYNLCDLFVLANRVTPDGDIETFGMVFVEANAAGKAVVGGRSGGAAEAIVDKVTGFLVDPEDVEEMAATLKMLLENPSLRQKLGAAGLRRARSEFDWKSRAQMLRQISDEIVQRARHGEPQ